MTGATVCAVTRFTVSTVRCLAICVKRYAIHISTRLVYATTLRGGAQPRTTPQHALVMPLRA